MLTEEEVNAAASRSASSRRNMPTSAAVSPAPAIEAAADATPNGDGESNGDDS